MYMGQKFNDDRHDATATVSLFREEHSPHNDDGHATQQDLSIIHRPKSFFVNVYNFVLPAGAYRELHLNDSIQTTDLRYDDY